MKVLPINAYTNNISGKYHKSNITAVKFRGVFGEPSSNEKFGFGSEALDNNTAFIVSQAKKLEDTLYNFRQNAEKIDTPIFKIYTLSVPDTEYGKFNRSENFCLFKKDNEYFVMGLSGLIFPKGETFTGDNNSVECGEIRKIYNDTKFSKYIGDEKPFQFFIPKRFDQSKADKYLSVNTRFLKKEEIQKFNSTSIAKLTRPEKKKDKVSKEFTFADIGGLDDIIEDLRKYVIRPINYPEVFENVRLNKGILLYGPPRCGKTLLGKALANEAGVEFKYLNANEFKNSAVGASESSVRKAIESIMQKPSILFLDEFDAIGKKREGSHNARYDDSVVNQLLGSMSDLEKSNAMSFIIAATNRKDLLDDALIASGRFGLHLEVPMPNEEALGAIYDIHTKKQPIDGNVSKQSIVSQMFENKFNGSDVAEMVAIAYFNALDRLGMNRKMDAKQFLFEDLRKILISKEDLELAIKKIGLQKLVR